MIDLNNEKNILAKAIAEKAIVKPENLFYGKLPGTRYSSQYYLSRILYNSYYLEIIANHFYDIVLKEYGSFDFQITGREWSSIPLLTAIPIYLKKNHSIDMNSFMIKRKRKNYGMHNYVEGEPNKLPVLIVDDLCNSTNSFSFCYDVLVCEKLRPIPFIFAVLNKHKPSLDRNCLLQDRYLQRGIKPLTILNGDDVDVFRKK